MAIIKGCVPVDAATYDVPMQVATVDQKRAEIFRKKFGDEASQKDLSAVTHVVKGKNIPPFLILHIADNPETKGQSHRIAKVLQEAGVSARTYSADGKTHATINADLGVPDDKPTQALFEFLAARRDDEMKAGPREACSPPSCCLAPRRFRWVARRLPSAYHTALARDPAAAPWPGPPRECGLMRMRY